MQLYAFVEYIGNLGHNFNFFFFTMNWFKLRFSSIGKLENVSKV